MGSDSARHSAYAELVAGLLDIRDQSAEARFDRELADAEAAGRIDPDTARTIRWWQREAQRALVAHAEAVLPPTLLAIERSYIESRDRLASVVGEGAAEPGATQTATDVGEDVDPTPAHEATPPTDLTARRLLVAGLTPMRDP